MRVRLVTKLTMPIAVPVYDLTVHELHNFKILNGPYVHNSKDISDALAGVVYGISRRLEVWAQHGVQIRKIVDSNISTSITTTDK